MFELKNKFDYLFFNEPVLGLMTRDNPKYINEYLDLLAEKIDNTIKYDKECFSKKMWEMGKNNLHIDQTVYTFGNTPHTIKEINKDNIIDLDNNKIELIDIIDYDGLNIIKLIKDVKNSWPNFGRASHLINNWQNATKWDKNNRAKYGWVSVSLKDFEPYKEFYTSIGKYLYETSKDFRELYGYGLVDDPKITKADIAQMNFPSFEQEYLDFLQSEFLVTVKPVDKDKKGDNWILTTYGEQTYEISNTQNFKERWDKASILVIGANYMPSERKRWEKIDKNYIGLGFRFVGTELKFEDGDPLDYDWIDVDSFTPLINLMKKTNKQFDIYIDVGVYQHLPTVMKLQVPFVFKKLTITILAFNKYFDKKQWKIIKEIQNPLWVNKDFPFCVIEKI